MRDAVLTPPAAAPTAEPRTASRATPAAALAGQGGQSVAAATVALTAAVSAGDVAAAAAALNSGGMPTIGLAMSVTEFATLLRALGDRSLEGTEGALLLMLIALVADRDIDKRRLYLAWRARRACPSPAE
jgi:hypothetical protein